MNKTAANNYVSMSKADRLRSFRAMLHDPDGVRALAEGSRIFTIQLDSSSDSLEVLRDDILALSANDTTLAAIGKQFSRRHLNAFDNLAHAKTPQQFANTFVGLRAIGEIHPRFVPQALRPMLSPRIAIQAMNDRVSGLVALYNAGAVTPEAQQQYLEKFDRAIAATQDETAKSLIQRDKVHASKMIASLNTRMKAIRDNGKEVSTKELVRAELAASETLLGKIYDTQEPGAAKLIKEALHRTVLDTVEQVATADSVKTDIMPNGSPMLVISQANSKTPLRVDMQDNYVQNVAPAISNAAPSTDPTQQLYLLGGMVGAGYASTKITGKSSKLPLLFPAASAGMRILQGKGPYFWRDKLKSEVDAVRDRALEDVERMLPQAGKVAGLSQDDIFAVQTMIGANSDQLARKLATVRAIQSSRANQPDISVRSRATWPEGILYGGTDWLQSEFGDPNSLSALDKFEQENPFGSYTGLITGIAGDIFETIAAGGNPTLGSMTKQNVFQKRLMYLVSSLSSESVADDIKSHRYWSILPTTIKQYLSYSVQQAEMAKNAALDSYHSGDIHGFVSSVMAETANMIMGRDKLRAIEFTQRLLYDKDRGLMLSEILPGVYGAGEYLERLMTGKGGMTGYELAKLDPSGRFGASPARRRFDKFLRDAKETLSIWEAPTARQKYETYLRQVTMSDVRELPQSVIRDIADARQLLEKNKARVELLRKQDPAAANFLSSVDWAYSKLTNPVASVVQAIEDGTQGWLKERINRAADFYDLARNDPRVSMAYWREQAKKNPLRHWGRSVAWSPEEANAWRTMLINKYDVTRNDTTIPWNRIVDRETAERTNVQPMTLGEMQELERQLAQRYRSIRTIEQYAQDSVIAKYGDRLDKMKDADIVAAMNSELYGEDGLLSSGRMGGTQADKLMRHYAATNDREIETSWVQRLRSGVSPMLLVLDRMPEGNRFLSGDKSLATVRKESASEYGKKYKYIGTELQRFFAEDPDDAVQPTLRFTRSATTKRLVEYKDQLGRIREFMDKDPRVRDFVMRNMNDPSFTFSADSRSRKLVGDLITSPTEVAKEAITNLSSMRSRLRADSRKVFSGMPLEPEYRKVEKLVRYRWRSRTPDRDRPIPHSAMKPEETARLEAGREPVYEYVYELVPRKKSLMEADYEHQKAWYALQKLYINRVETWIGDNQKKLQAYLAGDTNAMTQRELYDVADIASSKRPAFRGIPLTKENLGVTLLNSALPPMPKREVARKAYREVYTKAPQRIRNMDPNRVGAFINGTIDRNGYIKSYVEDTEETAKRQKALDEKYNKAVAAWEASTVKIRSRRAFAIRGREVRERQTAVGTAARYLLEPADAQARRLRSSQTGVFRATPDTGAKATEQKGNLTPMGVPETPASYPNVKLPNVPAPASPAKPPNVPAPALPVKTPESDVKPMESQDQQSSTMLPWSKNTADMKTDASRDFGQSLAGTLNTRKTEWIGKPNYRRTNRLGPLFQTRQT